MILRPLRRYTGVVVRLFWRMRQHKHVVMRAIMDRVRVLVLKQLLRMLADSGYVDIECIDEAHMTQQAIQPQNLQW